MRTPLPAFSFRPMMPGDLNNSLIDEYINANTGDTEMANRTTAAAPAAPQSQAVQHTTVEGFSIRILGFIPLPKGDLDAQMEAISLVKSLRSGEANLADLDGVLKQVQIDHTQSRKRVPVSEVEAWEAEAEEAESVHDDPVDGGEPFNEDGDIV